MNKILEDIIFAVSIWSMIAMLALAGCEEPDKCAETEMRCNENTVEICNGDKNWDALQKCSDLNEPEMKFVCCNIDIDGEQIKTCLPIADCEEGE